MITIIAKNLIKQGKTEEFKALSKELINQSRKEKGNISYNLYEDTTDSNILTFIEQWQDKEAINLHNNSAHFTSIVPKFAELKQGQSMINLYKILGE